MRARDWLRQQYPPDVEGYRGWTWGQAVAWCDPEVHARFRASARAARGANGRVVVEIEIEPMDPRSAAALAGLLFGGR